MDELYEFQNGRGETLDLSTTELRVLQRSGAGLPEMTIHTRRAPFQRGATFLAARPQPRRLSLMTLFKGGSYEGRIELERRVGRVMNPETGLGTLTINTATGDTRALDCYCVGGLDYPADAQIGPTARRAAILLEAPDPAWYDPTATVINFSGSGSGLRFPQAFPWTFVTTTASVGSVYTLTNAVTVTRGP